MAVVIVYKQVCTIVSNTQLVTANFATDYMRIAIYSALKLIQYTYL